MARSAYETLCMQYSSYRAYKEHHPEATHAEVLGWMTRGDWQRFAEDILKRSAARKRENMAKTRTVTKLQKTHSLSNTQRFRILKRDGYCCRLCGRSPQQHGIVLEVDHIIARANGGSNKDDNLHATCFDCNRGKRTQAL